MRKQQKSSLYFKCQGIKAPIWRGSLFHNLRAALCFNLDLGTARSTCSADLSDLLGVCKLKRSERQGGANLCLKNNKIWKSILKLNSSQCKDVPCLLPYDVWHKLRQRRKPECNKRKKMEDGMITVKHCDCVRGDTRCHEPPENVHVSLKINVTKLFIGFKMIV